MERRSVLIPSIVAFAMVLATDVLFAALINSQGGFNPMPYTPRFVGAYLAVMAAVVAIALVPRPEIVPIRATMRAGAAGGLLMLGFISAFSIGPPLVVAGLLVTFALSRTQRATRRRAAQLSGLVAAALAVVVLLAGFEVTQRLIVCPDTGTMAGGGAGFVTGPYQYECNNGQLTYH